VAKDLAINHKHGSAKQQALNGINPASHHGIVLGKYGRDTIGAELSLARGYPVFQGQCSLYVSRDRVLVTSVSKSTLCQRGILVQETEKQAL
jgi:hypothetical protein